MGLTFLVLLEYRASNAQFLTEVPNTPIVKAPVPIQPARFAQTCAVEDPPGFTS
jgi:hypothetical protein